MLLTFAHARFRRLLGEGLIRKDTNPDAAAALDMTRQGDTSRFERARVDSRGFHALEPEVAERESTPRDSAPRTRPFIILRYFIFFGESIAGLILIIDA